MNVFSTIYKENRWNGVESLSGPGSGTAATSVLAGLLPMLVRDLGALSVLSVGCGDDFWMPPLPGYLGVDVAPEAVARARLNHPGRSYRVLDAVRGPLPAADLAIVRDVLQHLSAADGSALLGNVVESGTRWLLASTYKGGSSGSCPESGGYWRPDLRDPPFSMPRPVRSMPDGYDYAYPGAVRDPSKSIALWAL